MHLDTLRDHTVDHAMAGERELALSSYERSLEIMAAAYEELGMTDLAADTRRVLAANFPGES